MEAHTVVQLKELLRRKGLKVSGRKAELIERLRAADEEDTKEKESESRASSSALVTVSAGAGGSPPPPAPKKKKKLFNPTAQAVVGNPLSFLASVAEHHPQDPVWKLIYTALHEDGKHPATASTRLSADDLEVTRYRTEARPIFVRQPFPKAFAAKLTPTEIKAFVASYYGDVFAAAVAGKPDCDLVDFAPAYLKARYHLTGSDVMPFRSRIRIATKEGYSPTIFYPDGFDAWLRKHKPFLVRVSLNGQRSDGTRSHHANCLCVDPLRKTASLFEPHGVQHKVIHRLLTMSLKEKGITFFGLEAKKVRLQTGDRLCASWSIYYAMLRMVNPSVPGAALLRTMSSKNLLRLLAWITFDVPQAKPCSLSGVFPGFRSRAGDTLGRDALISSSGAIVARTLGSRSRYHPDLTKYI